MIEQWMKELENPGTAYRSTPFWSFNDNLEPEELREQIRAMKEAGIGGFIMHARGGLLTPYMDDAWMNCIGACIDEAEKQDMHAWFYDEKGWPSGFGGGAVAAADPVYHLRWLCCEECPEGNPLSLPEDGEAVLGYYAVGQDGEAACLGENPAASPGCQIYAVYTRTTAYYVDVLNPACVKAFIASTYDRYYERFADDFQKAAKGFFTDEPQFSREIPWSTVFPEEFRRDTGEEVAEGLINLFLPCRGYERFRYAYYRMASRLYADSFGRQVYEWCENHHCQLTGHAMLEDSMDVQMRGTAGVMPLYPHMQQPGIDWLGRCLPSPVTPLQAGSVAAQTGRPFVLSEMFAKTGWDATPQDLKWVAEWQYIYGVNKMCQHLEGYSIRGNRKRDYPPSMFTQLPWFPEYRRFNDYFARLGKLLSDGEERPDLLLLHPMRSAWIAYDGGWKCPPVEKLDEAFFQTVGDLCHRQLCFHLGDEGILREMGKVEKNRLRVGKMSYGMVLLPSMISLEASTLELLLQAAEAGIPLVSLGAFPEMVEGEKSLELKRLRMQTQFPAPDELDRLLASYGFNRVTARHKDNSRATEIAAAIRHFKSHTAYVLMNSRRHEPADIHLQLRDPRPLVLLNLDNLQLTAADSTATQEGRELFLHFGPAQTMVLIAAEDLTAKAPVKLPEQILPLKEEWRVSAMTDNALTLDKCCYQLAGDTNWRPETEVCELMEQLVARRYEGGLRMCFRFEIREMPDPAALRLVCESVEKREIWINGILFDGKPDGWFVDKSFRTLPAGRLFREGINEIEISTRFHQTEDFYRAYDNKADRMEVEKNMRTYDTELESLYVIGPFGVYSNGTFIQGEKNSLFSDGPFYIGAKPQIVRQGSLTEQGFLCFSGSLTLEQTVVWDGVPVRIELAPPYAAVLRLTVNGQEAGEWLWDVGPLDVTPYLRRGENRIAITLVSGNRNLLGPFHMKDGECYQVEPDSFSRSFMGDGWREGYSFVKFGLRELS